MLTPGAVRTWYNTCIYFQDVKDFLFCAIVVIITNYAAAQNFEFGGSVFGDNRGNRGGRFGVSHKRKNFEIGGSVFGDNRGTRGGRFGVSLKLKNFEIGGSVFRDNRGNKGGRLGLKLRFRRSTQWVRFKFIYVNNCF